MQNGLCVFAALPREVGYGASDYLGMSNSLGCQAHSLKLAIHVLKRLKSHCIEICCYVNGPSQYLLP